MMIMGDEVAVILLLVMDLREIHFERFASRFYNFKMIEIIKGRTKNKGKLCRARQKLTKTLLVFQPRPPPGTPSPTTSYGPAFYTKLADWKGWKGGTS